MISTAVKTRIVNLFKLSNKW